MAVITQTIITCDNCLDTARGAYADPGRLPIGWFGLVEQMDSDEDRFRGRGVQTTPVHLCSLRCLAAWAKRIEEREPGPLMEVVPYGC